MSNTYLRGGRESVEDPREDVSPLLLEPLLHLLVVRLDQPRLRLQVRGLELACSSRMSAHRGAVSGTGEGWLAVVCPCAWSYR